VEEVVAKIMKANKTINILDHGNCEFEDGEFDYRGKHSEEQICCGGKGGGNVIGGIGQGKIF
jgi:hypothetical protein